MAKYQSAGVYISEVDKSTFTEESGGSYVASVIKSNWGSANEVNLIGNIGNYATTYGTPDSYTAKYFYNSKRILNGTNLYNTVRVVDANALNATTKVKKLYEVTLTTTTGEFVVGETVNGVTSSATGLLKEIDGDTLKLVDITGRFETTETVTGETSNATGTVSGNPSVDVALVYKNLTGTFTIGETVTGATSSNIGTILEIDIINKTLIVSTIGDFNSTEVITGATSSAEATLTSVTLYNSYTAGVLIENSDEFDKRSTTDFKFISAYPSSLGNSLVLSICDSTTFDNWKYKNQFDNAPDSGEYHIVVIDKDGVFYNTEAGDILETFAYVTKTPGSIDEQGLASYYKTVLNNQSEYVYAGDIDFDDYEDLGVDIGFFEGIHDNTAITDSEIVTGYELFIDPKKVTVDYISMQDYSTTVINSVYANVVNVRLGCVMFASPSLTDVLSNDVRDKVVTFGQTVTYDSKIFLSCNWIRELDTFNNVNIWTPDNGEIIRIKSVTDSNLDTWYSPMGYNRGIFNNVIKLAWNPEKADRDILTQASINPVFTEVGEGSLLLGDRTHLKKASFLRQVGVRCMFNKIERDIANFAKYTIGEFNDSITQTDFTLKVTKYMNELQSRNAFRDFRIFCSDKENTDQVKAEQGFKAIIKVLPNSSINWINLVFTPVSFVEQLDS